jgi:hypothetical protein
MQSLVNTQQQSKRRSWNPLRPSALGPVEGVIPTSAERDSILGPRAIIIGGTLILAATLCLHNLHLFREPLMEAGDFGGNAILTIQAKRFAHLVGTPSSRGFYHPGPALLYVFAVSEWLFHDVLGFFPATHNAQIFAANLMQAFWIGLTLAIYHNHFRSPLATGAGLATFLAYFAVGGHLTSHWALYLYYTQFLVFLAATASVAAGQSRHLIWMGLAGCFLVHGYVCFLAFVPPLCLYALVCWWRGFPGTTKRLIAAHWPSLVAFLAIVGLFILPIALNSIFHYPGEIAKYLDYSSRSHHGRHGIMETIQYVANVLTSSAAHGDPNVVRLCPHALWVIGATLAALVISWPIRSIEPRNRFTFHVAAVCLLATLLIAYYACFGLDHLQDVYTGIPFGAVLLTLLTTAAMNATIRVAMRPVAFWATLVTMIAVAATSLAVGRFTNYYRGSERALATIEAFLTTEGNHDVPVLVSVNNDCGTLSAFIVAMERRHQQVYVADTFNDHRFLWTSFYSSGWEDVPNLTYLDLADPREPRPPNTRILFENTFLSVRQYDGHYIVGSLIQFGGCRDAKAVKCYGWWDVEPDRTWTNGSEAKVVLNPDRAFQHDAVLKVTSIPFVTPRNPILCVDVLVNGVQVDQWTFDRGDEFQERSAPVPRDVVCAATPIQIVFRFHNVKSPAEVLPPSTDPRKLGLGVRSLRLSECSN